MAADGAHEQALLALDEAASTGHSASPAGCAPSRRASWPRQAPPTRRAVLLDPIGGLGDEDDVDVTDIVRFLLAGLAHPDDRQAALLVPVAVLLTGDREAASRAASASSARASPTGAGRSATGSGT